MFNRYLLIIIGVPFTVVGLLWLKEYSLYGYFHTKGNYVISGKPALICILSVLIFSVIAIAANIVVLFKHKDKKVP